MWTPIPLWLLLNLFIAPAFAQVPVYSLTNPPASPNSMRVDPVLQRERDSTRMGILQDELSKEAVALNLSENDCRNSKTSTASTATVQECTARVTLHRQNITALEREIALAQHPRSVATLRQPQQTSVAREPQRQPDDWVILPQQLPFAAPVAAQVSATSARHRLLPTSPATGQPLWIIPAGLRNAMP